VIVSVWVNTIQSLHKVMIMGNPKKLWYMFNSSGYFSKISKVKLRKRSKCKRWLPQNKNSKYLTAPGSVGPNITSHGPPN
jgi:hypothetical protein